MIIVIVKAVDLTLFNNKNTSKLQNEELQNNELQKKYDELKKKYNELTVTYEQSKLQNKKQEIYIEKFNQIREEINNILEKKQYNKIYNLKIEYDLLFKILNIKDENNALTSINKALENMNGLYNYILYQDLKYINDISNFIQNCNKIDSENCIKFLKEEIIKFKDQLIIKQ